MAKTLLTGATGFIGSHLARGLVQRGDDLRVTVRARSPVEVLQGIDCEQVRCDVTDRRAVRRALKGVDRVFHAAGVTSIRQADAERMFEVNVGGAKTVLGECLRADVARVVLTSSAAALGPAPRGGTADETQLFTAGHLDIPYVSSVHEAEVEAMRLAARGLPLVCVNPTATFGAGDIHLTSTRLVRNFLLGRLPMYSGGAFCMVDVRDVVRGHLLADELGGVAERYILGGRNFTFDRFFADLGRISGVAPPVRIPGPLATVGARALAIAGRSPLRRNELSAARHWWTYRATKAKRELLWRARPHEETLEDTVAWHLEREHERIARTRHSQQLQYRLAGAALGTADGAMRAVGQVLGRNAPPGP
ncbi:MAG: SDR family NAD(P)-dependent oxidoreductase [Actinomycetota bacterium]|nr:SDR family NAD(P)-dependent oxidoreductase [Actinomycetota bacterium]MDQ3719645.1 SDR family NAD(P)-dependent oxidoreductase [Actinomycetota bacterium]